MMKRVIFTLFIILISINFAFSDLPLEEMEALHNIALKSNDMQLRVKAIRALGRIGSRKSIAILSKIMTEAVTEVRRNDPQYHARMEKARVAALRAMRKIGMNTSDANVVSPKMIQVMRADPAEIVQSEAALSLGVIGAKTSGNIKARVVENMIYKLNRCPNTKNLLAFMLIKGFRKLNVRTNKVAHALLGAYQRGYLAIVRLAARTTIKALFPGKFNL